MLHSKQKKGIKIEQKFGSIVDQMQDLFFRTPIMHVTNYLNELFQSYVKP